MNVLCFYMFPSFDQLTQTVDVATPVAPAGRGNCPPRLAGGLTFYLGRAAAPHPPGVRSGRGGGRGGPPALAMTVTRVARPLRGRGALSGGGADSMRRQMRCRCPGRPWPAATAGVTGPAGSESPGSRSSRRCPLSRRPAEVARAVTGTPRRRGLGRCPGRAARPGAAG